MCNYEIEGAPSEMDLWADRIHEQLQSMDEGTEKTIGGVLIEYKNDYYIIKDKKITTTPLKLYFWQVLQLIYQKNGIEFI